MHAGAGPLIGVDLRCQVLEASEELRHVVKDPRVSVSAADRSLQGREGRISVTSRRVRESKGTPRTGTILRRAPRGQQPAAGRGAAGAGRPHRGGLRRSGGR